MMRKARKIKAAIRIYCDDLSRKTGKSYKYSEIANKLYIYSKNSETDFEKKFQWIDDAQRYLANEANKFKEVKANG